MPADPVQVQLNEEFYYLLGSSSASSTTANEASNSLRVEKYLNHAYQIISSGGSVSIQYSLDGVNWFTADTRTTTTYNTVNGMIYWVRAVRDATTAPVKVIWAARDYYPAGN
jgi:hypothetical protein